MLLAEHVGRKRDGLSYGGGDALLSRRGANAPPANPQPAQLRVRLRPRLLVPTHEERPARQVVVPCPLLRVPPQEQLLRRHDGESDPRMEAGTGRQGHVSVAAAIASREDCSPTRLAPVRLGNTPVGGSEIRSNLAARGTRIVGSRGSPTGVLARGNRITEPPSRSPERPRRLSQPAVRSISPRLNECASHRAEGFSPRLWPTGNNPDRAGAPSRDRHRRDGAGWSPFSWPGCLLGAVAAVIGGVFVRRSAERAWSQRARPPKAESGRLRPTCCGGRGHRVGADRADT